MRTSSIKTIITATSLTLTILAAAPLATAQPAGQKTQTTRTREQAPTPDRFAAIRESINRALRRIGLQSGITIPVPAPAVPAED